MIVYLERFNIPESLNKNASLNDFLINFGQQLKFDH